MFTPLLFTPPPAGVCSGATETIGHRASRYEDWPGAACGECSLPPPVKTASSWLAGSLGPSESSAAAAALSLLTRLEPATENFDRGHQSMVLFARAPSTYSCRADGRPVGVVAAQTLSAPASFFQASPGMLTPPETVPPTMLRWLCSGPRTSGSSEAGVAPAP